MSQEPVLLDALNDRELEIIPLLAQRLSNKEIANQLFLAPNTIKWIVRQLNSKLDTTNRKEIVQRANQLGILTSPSTETYLRPRENLPRQTTPFIGRDTELDELHTILGSPDVRLVTILALGGMGKTRIALEAAAQQLNNFPDGVYFIPLQALTDIEQIIRAIASSCYYPFQADDDRSQKQQVLDFLANKHMLLLVDNFEHLLDASSLLNEILHIAPAVKLLVTSREKLNLMGETIYVLQGMEIPKQETPKEAIGYDAVQLLQQGVRRVQPDWQITPDNLHIVTRICRLTYGMPLGIVLAASWLDVYSLERISDEIEKSADILETEMRDVPERQRSIRAVFEYSWKRLKPNEQNVLMKMSVFKGGCSPQAVEHITGAHPRNLQSLVNKALLSKNRQGRYDIHELLRQYAEERLRAQGSLEVAKEAHFKYYAQVISDIYPRLLSPDERQVTDQVEQDFDNFRMAWDYAIDHGFVDIVDRMTRSLEVFFELRWHPEWIDMRQVALEKMQLLYPKHSRLVLLTILNIYDSTKDDLERISIIEGALDRAREYQQPWDEARCLRRLNTLYQQVNRFEEAWQLLDKAEIISQGLDERVLVGWVFRDRGLLLVAQNNFDAAKHYFQAEYDHFQKLGYKTGIATAIADLGVIAMETNDIRTFLKHSKESLEISLKLSHQGIVAFMTSNVALGHWLAGDLEHAQQAFYESTRITQELNMTRLLIHSLLYQAIFLWTNEQESLARTYLAQVVSLIPYRNDPQETLVIMIQAYFDADYLSAKEAYITYLNAIRFSNISLNYSKFSLNYSEYVELRIFALSLAYTGDTELSIILLANIYKTPWITPNFDDKLDYKNWLARIQRDTSPEDFNVAWERGTAMDLKDVQQLLEKGFTGDDL